MIGFYDYTVIPTYISLLFSIFGITQAIDGRFRLAIVCLALSGLCDMLDGKVARTKKNRTSDQKFIRYTNRLIMRCDLLRHISHYFVLYSWGSRNPGRYCYRILLCLFGY